MVKLKSQIEKFEHCFAISDWNPVHNSELFLVPNETVTHVYFAEIVSFKTIIFMLAAAVYNLECN